MAIIIPFADADAHGSICDTVSFRRSRGKVVFQKKPKPKQPNTQAQQDQKQWWKNTWKNWRQLSTGQLAWLQAQATAEQTTPANYFFDKYKDAHGASGERQYLIKTIDNLVIDNPIGSIPFHFYLRPEHYTYPAPGGAGMGIILDNENIWHPSSYPDPLPYISLRIRREEDPPVTIPDNYSMTWTYTDIDDVQHVEVLYFPELELQLLTEYLFYFDTSMSMYWDIELTNLVKENFWPYPWPPF
jgi:hypothetical protein